MDKREQSSEAFQEEEAEKTTEDEHKELDGVGDDGDCGYGVAEVGGEERREFSELPPIEAESGGPQSETLAAASSSLQLFDSDYQLSGDLTEVPVDYAFLRPLESEEFKNTVGLSHQQALVSVTTESTQVQSRNQFQSAGCPTSSSELSPTSVTQSISSTPSPTLLDQKISPVANANGGCRPQVEQQNSGDAKTTSAALVLKTPLTSVYSWRKYGQKQVKSPQGSRSYYKCTYSDCQAKKIECCDHLNRVIEVISRGQHTHDPPQRINCTRESRFAVSAAPGSRVPPLSLLNDSDPSTSSREPIQETPSLHETKQESPKVSKQAAEVDIKEEHVDEPEPKRRLKKNDTAFSGSVLKPGKKPKFVVRAAGDVGISGDGYRWRKYGQKMVKGNPHPRNYYRCTSAGCPVRKHIERAVDNTSVVIITYKGIHDHDMPVPKKRHGLPSAPLVAAAAPASMNSSQFKKTESTTQWSVDREGELTGETMDAGEEKAMESARTLLSIGFEIKQC
ncbi:probable WRKY transcription factor 32 [Diospyros lotus]|uniref:probable WRKY transcription factor 32 n=1 Tax=Diospyros lotus TaxID=55363 RepID=UPI002257ED16|nr:probable WRKY transcription factor 32 [Diospyros lotus]